ncbi:transcriptional regulator WhiB [Streptomyces lavendofoliae]|uniref:Transcriptional regulator WhiB n=2 Tax=Streptomyces lavendofoliae TaxID=67314 RepID=A0A918M1S2_9ACTN|nr:transcriptional regulator WhiB [Streptomyces lavendofoliae]
MCGMPINSTASSDELSWQDTALCAQTGPDFFFPDPGSSTREAKRLCAACDIREACLEYALTHDERFGVWGGLSEKERYALRRRGR